MENNKTPFVILGVLAAGAITYFFFFRKKDQEKSKTSGEVKGSKTSSADMKKNRQINFI